MSLPLSALSTDIVQWCSYQCGGSPATNVIKFKFFDEDEQVMLCDECLPVFIERGPL